MITRVQRFTAQQSTEALCEALQALAAINPDELTIDQDSARNSIINELMERHVEVRLAFQEWANSDAVDGQEAAVISGAMAAIGG